MTPRRRVSWAHVIDILEKYLSLRDDWPITSPLGKLNEGGTDDVQRGESGTLAWVVDVGGCLERLPTEERETVLEVAHVRRAEENAAAQARNAAWAARRSGAVHDVRDAHARTRREWVRIADDHQQRRRRMERRRAYKDGMDRMTVLIIEVVKPA